MSTIAQDLSEKYHITHEVCTWSVRFFTRRVRFLALVMLALGLTGCGCPETLNSVADSLDDGYDSVPNLYFPNSDPDGGPDTIDEEEDVFVTKIYHNHIDLVDLLSEYKSKKTSEETNDVEYFIDAKNTFYSKIISLRANKVDPKKQEDEIIEIVTVDITSPKPTKYIFQYVRQKPLSNNFPSSFVWITSSLVSSDYESQSEVSTKIDYGIGSVGVLLPGNGITFVPTQNEVDKKIWYDTRFIFHPNSLTDLRPINGKEFGCSTKGCRHAESYGYKAHFEDIGMLDSGDEHTPIFIVHEDYEFKPKFRINLEPDTSYQCSVCLDSFYLGQVPGSKEENEPQTIQFSASRDLIPQGESGYRILSQVNAPYDVESAAIEGYVLGVKKTNLGGQISYRTVIFEEKDNYYMVGWYYSYIHRILDGHVQGVFILPDGPERILRHWGVFLAMESDTPLPKNSEFE